MRNFSKEDIKDVIESLREQPQFIETYSGTEIDDAGTMGIAKLPTLECDAADIIETLQLELLRLDLKLLEALDPANTYLESFKRTKKLEILDLVIPKDRQKEILDEIAQQEIANQVITSNSKVFANLSELNLLSKNYTETERSEAERHKGF